VGFSLTERKEGLARRRESDGEPTPKQPRSDSWKRTGRGNLEDRQLRVSERFHAAPKAQIQYNGGKSDASGGMNHSVIFTKGLGNRLVAGRGGGSAHHRAGGSSSYHKFNPPTQEGVPMDVQQDGIRRTYAGRRDRFRSVASLAHVSGSRQDIRVTHRGFTEQARCKRGQWTGTLSTYRQ